MFSDRRAINFPASAGPAAGEAVDFLFDFDPDFVVVALANIPAFAGEIPNKDCGPAGAGSTHDLASEVGAGGV
jgi:hypothetical protein